VAASAVQLLGARAESGRSARPCPKGQGLRRPLIKIGSLWKYHLNSYIGAPNLGTEFGSLYAVYIGEIQLVQFTDGSAQVSVAGYRASLDSASNVFSDVFSDSFFMSSGSGPQDFLRKFDSYSNARLHYKIALGVAPTVGIKLDGDNNPDNDTLSYFTMTKQ